MDYDKELLVLLQLLQLLLLLLLLRLYNFILDALLPFIFLFSFPCFSFFFFFFSFYLMRGKAQLYYILMMLICSRYSTTSYIITMGNNISDVCRLYIEAHWGKDVGD